MRRPLFLLIALLLAACGASDGDGDSQSGRESTTSADAAVTASPSTTTEPPSPGCGREVEPGDPTAERSFTTTNGEERTYLLDLPSGYDGSTPADVVFNFHGRGSNAIQQYVYADFDGLAERDGVILVTPDSLVRNGSMQWSPGTPGSGGDLDFVAELVEQIRTDHCTDRFFATGMSSGGFMTTSLACQRDGDFEAFGPVTLWFYDDTCEEAPPRPIIEFHGTADAVVPFDGGARGTVLTIGAAWAEHNGCDPEPVIEPIGQVDRHLWTNCASTTELYVVNGGGHTWPGAIEVPGLGLVTSDISATEIIWDLFFTARD